MGVVGYTRPGLLCVQCGEPFTLSHARPDVSRIDELSNPFKAACPECAHEAPYQKSSIQIMVPVDGA
jgi:DNA-directed RNA polymerase subunit RPC12/RpoP